MKTSTKVWIAFLLVMAILMTVGAVFLIRYALASGHKDRSGWATKAGAICYLDAEGNPLLGWQDIEGKRYYFVPDAGIRATGWVQIGNDRYYFGDDGVVRTGWQEIDGRTYYLGDAGKLALGLYSIDGKGYYFDKTGVMGTGWQTADGVLCYFAETGEAMPGWQEIDGIRYCFKETGEAMVGWNTLDGKPYYFTEEGRTLTGWQTLEEKRYYFAGDGYALTGWQSVEGIRSCFGEDGAAVTGWYEENGSKYYLDQNGTPLVGKQQVEDCWYYFREDGALATGWIETEDGKYYAKENGMLAVGQLTLDGVNHFFTSKGNYVLLVNKDNPVPEDFLPDLASFRGFRIDSQAKEALEKMMSECPYSTTIDNIYRSKEQQIKVWNNGIKERMASGMTYEQAEAATAKRVMTPGHSEHQTGLAVDMFGSDAAQEWLIEHCWEYGFILRYPEDKTEFTGIDFENWHFRYVGTELSLELKELGMCLEEYMIMLTQ